MMDDNKDSIKDEQENDPNRARHEREKEGELIKKRNFFSVARMTARLTGISGWQELLCHDHMFPIPKATTRTPLLPPVTNCHKISNQEKKHRTSTHARPLQRSEWKKM